MQIIRGKYPPNYKKIAATFGLKSNDGIVFTYGDKLFVPSGNKIDPYLLAHEETHARQQLTFGVEDWWDRFLTDKQFRLEQEVEAYRNQYASMGTLSPRDRLGYLNHIATGLSSSMYGNLMTKEEAKFIITKDIKFKPVKPQKSKNNNSRKRKKRERQNRKKGRR